MEARKPRRLRLENAQWKDLLVLDVAGNTMLIEAPIEPLLEIGFSRGVAVAGLGGIAVVVDAYQSVDMFRRYYLIEIVEHDAGLMDEIVRLIESGKGALELTDLPPPAA